ncbi:Putative ABC transport system substrate-binding protein OS=Bosea thiooxidans OX=53254 GN=SAMN05660750_01092 PE=4 SV=1 [Bosea thiooxidans]|uniref:Putative ABC transport system substrate-binding protein n=2 Tax=Bosea thiooxidans TaxID=53254 RepID=A0A1T5BWK3_9HYPH|nr:putative ABC transport system substrate-binding protein [Bosea thiooxidans]
MRFLPSASARAADGLSRRDLILLAGGAAAWAVPARSQQPAMPVLGYLGSESPERYASRLAAFREGLAETGYVEGRNLAVEYRWAEGNYQRLPALAKELADRQVVAIVAPGGAEVALAAKSATMTIPIVFEMGGDPIALGVVDSLSQPGGNLTGVSSLSVEVSRKRLEFMAELRRGARLFAIAVNRTSPTANSQIRNLQAAADSLGLQLRQLEASTEQEFEALFASVAQVGAGGLVFTSDPYFAYRSPRLAALAVAHAVPAITQSRDFPIAGGLMSYGGDFLQSHRHTGAYAGRIIKGEKPSQLPVQRVTKVELFINLKAANALGLSVPPSLLSSADFVIE